MTAGELDGRVAVVSGGSRGLGRAISRELAAAGARVVVNYANREGPAAETVRDIQRTGGTAAAVRGDVTTEDGAARVVHSAAEQFGAVDVLVNNAVGGHPSVPVVDSDWQTYADQLRFSAAAPVLLGLAALPLLRRRGFGRIINIGSEIVGRPAPGMAAYLTAKSAMVGLTQGWAFELGEFGITVNLVAPGFVPVERHDEVTQEERDAYLADVPLARMGAPEDVAGVVVFLASDRAAFVTGQVLTVNGGRTV